MLLALIAAVAAEHHGETATAISLGEHKLWSLSSRPYRFPAPFGPAGLPME
jgi:hypothetical protein